MSQIHVKLTRSVIRMHHTQRDTVRTLGFRRIHQVISVQDSPAVRGMINKVAFALEVLPELPKPGYQWKGVTVTAGKGLPKKKAAPKAEASSKKTKKKAATKKKVTKKKATKKKATKKKAKK